MKKTLLFFILLIFSITLVSAATLDIDTLGGDHGSQCAEFYFDHNSADVSFDYLDSDPARLKGIINGTGLRPNTTYQVKILGKPTCLYGVDGDDAANDNIGYKGRWTCTNCAGDASARNRNDAQYEACKADPNCTDCIQSYLVFDFITTNADGDVVKYIESDSSYHVLYCNDGVCGTTGNDNSKLDAATATCPAEYVEGQIERFSCNGLTFEPGEYDAVIALTFESFHLGSGCWVTVLMNEDDLEFTIEDIIPEFSLFGGILAVVGVLVGLVLLKRE